MQHRRSVSVLLALMTLATSSTVTWAGTTTKAYPTGNRANSVILIERVLPNEVRAGTDFEYRVRVINLTSAKVNEVVLRETMPEAFQSKSVTPKPTSTSGQDATWNLGTLEPKASREFRFTGSIGRVGNSAGCTHVTFTTEACSGLKIVEPKLELVKTAPPRVLVCDAIPIKFVVTNPGSGPAENVEVKDQLPEGWTTSDGRKVIVKNLGTLPAGQSREFTATVRSSAVGSYDNTAVATAAGGLSAESTATTQVVTPVLSLVKSCPEKRYIGRAAKFELTLTNTGDAAARDTNLRDAIPAGMTFISASDNGRFNSGHVFWNLGTLEPGASRTVTVTAKPTRAGDMRNTASAKAYCANASADCVLQVRGIPAILLEVVDIEDPIEIGTNVTYVITVTNQGSANGTNINVVCDLPPEQSHVTAKGPTNANVSGKTITFAPYPSLAPKAKLTYRVVARGDGPGDVRFRVSLTSDQMTSPAGETESTHIYE